MAENKDRATSVTAATIRRWTDIPGLHLIPPSEMSRIDGGRCWDGPLGDRDECPPKQSSTSPTLTGDGSFTLEISCGSTF
jgi:hypothetical protein